MRILQKLEGENDMKLTRKEYKTLIKDRMKMKNHLQRLGELEKRICILEEQLAVRKGETKAGGEAEGVEEAEKSRPLRAPELYDCREDLPVY